MRWKIGICCGACRSELDEIEAKIVQLGSGAKGADWISRNCAARRDPGKLPVEVSRKMDQFVKNQSGRRPWNDLRQIIFSFPTINFPVAMSLCCMRFSERAKRLAPQEV